MKFPALDRHGIPWRLVKCGRRDRLLERLCLPIAAREARALRAPDQWIPSLRRKLLSGSCGAEPEAARQRAFRNGKKWADAFARSGAALGLDELRELHARLTGGAAPGAFRSGAVVVRDARGKRICGFPPASAVPALLADLLRWRESAAARNPLIRAVGTHLILLSIHPFRDGNGRVARMIEYADLRRAGCGIVDVVHPETAAHWDFSAYCAVMMASRKAGRLDFALDHVLQGYRLFRERGAPSRVAM